MSLTSDNTILSIWDGNSVEETHVFHLRNATQWCCAEERGTQAVGRTVVQMGGSNTWMTVLKICPSFLPPPVLSKAVQSG